MNLILHTLQPNPKASTSIQNYRRLRQCDSPILLFMLKLGVDQCLCIDVLIIHNPLRFADLSFRYIFLTLIATYQQSMYIRIW